MDQAKNTLTDSRGNTVKTKNKMFDIFRCFKYVKFNWVLILLALAASITESILSSKVPDMTSQLFDGNFSYEKLWQVVGNTLLVFLMFSITTILLNFASARATLSARKSVWRRLMTVKMNYYDTNDPMALLNTVTSDAELIATSVCTILVKIPSVAVLIATCMKIVAGYNMQLLALLGTIVAIHILYMVFIGGPQKKVSKKGQIQVGFFTAFLAERIKNFPMIKSYATQDKEAENGHVESKKIYKIGQQQLVITGFQSFYQAFIYLLGTVITVIWGCALIRNGDITVQQFIGVNMYIQIINVVFIMVSVYWVLIKTFSGQAYRIARLCEAPQEDDKNIKVVCSDGEIKVNATKFGFAQNKANPNKKKQPEKKAKISMRITVSVKGFSNQTERLNELMEAVKKYDKENGDVKVKIKQGKKHLYIYFTIKDTHDYKACATDICAALLDADKNTDFADNDVISLFCNAMRKADNARGITDIPSGDIKFRNVDFSYTGTDKIIDNATFTVPQGKITALVGPSGSGKTTIVKLLENLYSPTAGSIKIADVNIKDINTFAWRRKLAYVVQDAGIFSGTMRECLTYGVERDVTDEELDEVTRLTGIYDYIHLSPLKYETPVASWGASLSGGQRQRVVISRALLRQADILIFDEPTSALDPETANNISKLIFEKFKDKTVIIISHELNYIAKADNIVFLHDGVIEGEGDHATLMEECKTYHDLVEQQSYTEVFGK